MLSNIYHTSIFNDSYPDKLVWHVVQDYMIEVKTRLHLSQVKLSLRKINHENYYWMKKKLTYFTFFVRFLTSKNELFIETNKKKKLLQKHQAYSQNP